MKPFQFKLEPALNVKLKQEERQKEELNKIRDILTDNEVLLSSMQTKLEHLHNELRKYQQEAINLADMQTYHTFLPVFNQRIAEQTERINMLQKQVEKAQGILVGIRKERKVLEKLKDRHFKEYKYEEQKEEQKTIDEMANRKYYQNDGVLNGGYS